MGSREFTDYKLDYKPTLDGAFTSSTLSTNEKEEPNLFTLLSNTKELTLALVDKITVLEAKIMRINLFIPLLGPDKERKNPDQPNSALTTLSNINDLYVHQLNRLDNLVSEMEKITG